MTAWCQQILLYMYKTFVILFLFNLCKILIKVYLTRQMMIPLGLPNADSAVPQSPVSGNVSSARGLPLAGPGIGSTPRLGGMSLKISFIPSGSRCPVARAETSPSSTLQTVLLCILAVHIPLPVVVSGGSRRHSGRCLNASLQLL